MSGAIVDQELMLEQQRLRSDTANAARAEEFREGDKQVGRQEEQIAHASNIIKPVIARKTARHGLFGLDLRFTNSPRTGINSDLPGQTIARCPRTSITP